MLRLSGSPTQLNKGARSYESAPGSCYAADVLYQSFLPACASRRCFSRNPDRSRIITRCAMVNDVTAASIRKSFNDFSFLAYLQLTMFTRERTSYCRNPTACYLCE